ncbi:MAG TPA: DUF4019 domain-containing protein [Desulfomonilia bacterium]
MIRKSICLVVIGIFLCAVPVLAANTEKEKAAIAAAEKWLKLVDQGNFTRSWQESSRYFKMLVKEDQWIEAAQSTRSPLGKLVSRKVKSATYTTKLPSAPDGEYVVIEFQASFKNKKSAIETVTPMVDKDGKWRVSGYYIR